MGQSGMAVGPTLLEALSGRKEILGGPVSFLLRRSREAIYAEMNTHATSLVDGTGKKEKTMRVGEQQ
jgi:hypothetical protein